MTQNDLTSVGYDIKEYSLLFMLIYIRRNKHVPGTGKLGFNVFLITSLYSAHFFTILVSMVDGILKHWNCCQSSIKRFYKRVDSCRHSTKL